MLPTIDYDDMVKTGQAKEAVPKAGERKYAVIIKSARASVGKFDITDKESTAESIIALETNANIPDAIRKSAEYFVKTAANYHGLVYNVDPEPAPHEIIISDIIVKSAEHADVPMISFGSRKFILSDEMEIKRAEEYFLGREHLIPPTERINVSRIIVKAAAMAHYIPDNITRAYSRAEYGNSVPEILSMKSRLSRDAKYASVMEKLSRCYSNIPVNEFLGMIDSCDKAISAKHSKYGIEPHQLLMDKPKTAAEDIMKEASKKDPILEVVRDK